jgi:cellulose synthase/poly-beta-1,6-N-acetylglucosamine synthase-like glycosyltransferase
MTILIIDWILFIILALCAGYLLLFAISSLFYHDRKFPETNERQNFLVLFPAYAEDNVIINTVQSFLKQNYPKEYYHVAVISDHQQDSTNETLQSLPITTLIATYENSSKAKALNFAIDHIKGTFDSIVILDADNIAPENFLSELNKIRAQGIKAIQVHRKGIVTESNISILDGVSEEINNGIFRKGHQCLGLSSALTGSGMAFDYNWFCSNIKNVFTAGEDKELEAILLKQRIRIVYIDSLYVLDKKTEKKTAIGNQRRRWMASQFGTMKTALHDLPHALFTLNCSYADKIIQWMLPPRLIQLSLIFGFTIIFAVFYPDIANKWIWLSVAQILAMILPIPKEYANKRLFKAILQIPVLAFKVFLNLFHLKEASRNFIHTKH